MEAQREEAAARPPPFLDQPLLHFVSFQFNSDLSLWMFASQPASKH